VFIKEDYGFLCQCFDIVCSYDFFTFTRRNGIVVLINYNRVYEREYVFYVSFLKSEEFYRRSQIPFQSFSFNQVYFCVGFSSYCVLSDCIVGFEDL
jgi:hypothetical protein